MLLTFHDFSALLADAADVHPVVLDSDVEAGVLVLSVEVGASSVPVEVRLGPTGVELSAEDHALLEGLKENRQQHQRRHRDKVGAGLDVLKEYQLPFHWNREWLEEKFDEVGSFGAIARKFRREVQGATQNSIAGIARSHFGLTARDRLVRTKTRFLKDFEEQHMERSQASFAEEFGVTESTISRWIRDGQIAYNDFMKGWHEGRLQEPGAVAAFARERSLLENLFWDWRRDGSDVYREVTPRGKHAYHGRQAYEELYEQFLQVYEVEGEDLNQSALALKLDVDRGTIRKWMKRADEKFNPYK